MHMLLEDALSVFSATSSTTFDEIKASYHTLILKIHPDKRSSSNYEDFLRIKDAWDSIQKHYKYKRLQATSYFSTFIDREELSMQPDGTIKYKCKCGFEISVHDSPMIECEICSLFYHSE